jgi:F-type H+-transporting ATPase subunit a
MGSERFVPQVVAQLGPVEITATVLYSLLVSVVLIVAAGLARIGLRQQTSGWPVVAEMLIEHLEDVMRDMSGQDPRPFTPLIVTLALFIGVANLLGLLPGLHAPTADLATTAALAAIVFLAVPIYGIALRGWRGYLHHYLEPTPLLLPLEIVAELSRTLAMAVRLFGNVLSGELVIGVLLVLAGVLVPVPVMLLSVLTGVVQAYIFAILAVVYLSAAVRAPTGER